jgi:hypothetical protein
LILGLVASSAVMAQGRVAVKVTERQDSNIAYNYAFVSGYTGITQNLNLRGATLTLQLPNGDTAVVNGATNSKSGSLARATFALAACPWWIPSKPTSTATRQN